ncbi:hypothetical protein P7584_15510, partial [Staphylococcus aureus]|nr:hypothetical protein [Staphylococcus aureus]
ALAYTIGIGAFYLFHLKVMPSRLRAGFAYIKKYWLRLSITYIYKFNQIVTNELNKFKGFETSYIINENQVSYYEIITLLNKRP